MATVVKRHKNLSHKCPWYLKINLQVVEGCRLPVHFTVPVTVALNCENTIPRTGLDVTVTTCSLGVNARPAVTSGNVITG